MHRLTIASKIEQVGAKFIYSFFFEVPPCPNYNVEVAVEMISWRPSPHVASTLYSSGMQTTAMHDTRHHSGKVATEPVRVVSCPSALAAHGDTPEDARCENHRENTENQLKTIHLDRQNTENRNFRVKNKKNFYF